MHAIRNQAKARLAAGELALGIGLRQARTADIGSIAKTAGFDWLFIDMEHNSMSIDTAAQICAGALHAGVAPIIRVPGHEPFHATRLLDTGAQGIVVPHVSNAEEAASIARMCLFPPRGTRSIPGLLPQVNFETHEVAEAHGMLGAELEAKEVLERSGESCPPGLRGNAREIDAIDTDRPRRGRVEAAQQLDQRRLARAVLADDRDDGARRKLERYVLEHQPIRPRVAKGDTFEADAAREPIWRRLVGAGAQ